MKERLGIGTICLVFHLVPHFEECSPGVVVMESMNELCGLIRNYHLQAKNCIFTIN
jgi:hypothetical protein